MRSPCLMNDHWGNVAHAGTKKTETSWCRHSCFVRPTNVFCGGWSLTVWNEGFGQHLVAKWLTTSLRTGSFMTHTLHRKAAFYACWSHRCVRSWYLTQRRKRLYATTSIQTWHSVTGPLGPRHTTSSLDWRSRVKSFASLDERTHPCPDLASNAAFRDKVWVMKYRGRESFRHNLVYKAHPRLQLAWWTPRSIEEQVRRGLFADHNLFAVSVFFFFSIPQCNCWSGPIKLRNKFSSCGPTVKGGQPTTWCRRQRFMFDKHTSIVVGWTGESGYQESTVKSVKAKWTISVERERTLSPTEFSPRWEWFDIDRFPRKMSQRTVVEVIRRQKTQKKSRRNGGDAGTSSALTWLRLTPRFRHFFGVVMEIWKNAVALIKKRRSVPRP